MITSTTAPTEVPTAIPIVEPLVPEWLDAGELAAELDARLKLGLRRDPDTDVLGGDVLGIDVLGVDVPCDVLSDVSADVPCDVPCDGEDAKEVIDFAVPNFDPIENWFIAPTPEQQLPLNWAGGSPLISQHILPPSPAHLSEHVHTETP